MGSFEKRARDRVKDLPSLADAVGKGAGKDHPDTEATATALPGGDKVQRKGAQEAAEAAAAAAPIKEARYIPLSDLHVRPGYERDSGEFEGEGWEVFKSSIAASKGNLMPLTVRFVRGAGHPTAYQIIAGHSRFHAMSQLGIEYALCEVREFSDEEADVLHDVENAKRAAKRPYSLGLQLSKMMASGRYASKQDLADRLGRDSTEVGRHIALIDAAPVGLWQKVRDPSSVKTADLRALVAAYDKSEFQRFAKHLPAGEGVPFATVLAKAKAVTAKPRPEKKTVDKIREIQRGSDFHIILPGELSADLRKKVLEYARTIAKEG